MPIITIQAIKGVVLTSDEQKRELMKRMTDTFIDVVGEVARPYTYCLIQETPLYEWAIAGEPQPALEFLSGPEYAGMHQRSNKLMRDYVNGSQPAASESTTDADTTQTDKAAHAERVWRGDDRG
jgi:4-oxalocrotonate tautomerase